MMTRKSSFFLAIVLLCCLIFSHPVLGITPYDDVMVQQAVQNLQQENYDEALALMTQAWRKAPAPRRKPFCWDRLTASC
jgi:hypothetical protein